MPMTRPTDLPPDGCLHPMRIPILQNRRKPRHLPTL